MSEAAAAAESAGSGEHAVTPLELFFDLVFVFAITQVTALLTHDPSWHGVIRGALALAAVWWAWTGYAWLTSTLCRRPSATTRSFSGSASSPCGFSTSGCTRTPARTILTFCARSSASHRPK
jgi:hypothetical protein